MPLTAVEAREGEVEPFLSAILNALPTHVAILDHRGVVRTINGTWRAFTGESGLPGAGIGDNYLDRCDQWAASGDRVAFATADGIRRILDGSQSTFSVEYACTLVQDQRYFATRVTRFRTAGQVWIAVTREDITQRKKAEDAMRASEARFRSLIENAADVITILDEEGEIQYASPSAKRILGSGVPEYLGRSFFDFVHAEDLPRVMQGFTRSLDQPGKKVVLEFRWRCGSGPWKVMEGSAKNLLRDASVGGVVVNCREVTERKRAEEAQVRLTAVMDWTPSFVTIADPHGRLFYLNRATRRLLGLAGQEAPTHLNLTDLHPQWVSDLLLHEGIPTAIRDGVWTGETALVDASGAEVPVLQVLIAHKSRGAVDYFSTIAHDISERKVTEAALRESDEIFRQIAENISETLWIFDLDQGRPVYVSPGYERIWGRPVEAVLKDPSGFLACVAPADRQRVVRLPAVGSAGGADEEFQITRPDKAVRWLRGRSFPIRDARGSVCRIVGITEDITDRKQLESELRQSQRLEAIGHLAAGIAHEINTPIQYVGDNLRFLQESFHELSGVLTRVGQLDAGTDGAEVDAELEALRTEAASADLDYMLTEIPQAVLQSLEGVERVAEIVRAMKDFSHPGSADKVPIDVNKAILSTLTVARNEWRYVAELVTDFQPDLPLLPCFPGEFNQAILNIVINAAHAIADVVGDQDTARGQLTVSTSSVGEAVEIRISDTGAGIPEEVRPRVFDPFFTTKEVGRGTGQGLTLVHSVVVDKLGGSVSFETEIGGGTTFVLRLPLQMQPPKSELVS